MHNIMKSDQLIDRVFEYGFTRTFDSGLEKPVSKVENMDEYMPGTGIYEDAIKAAEEIVAQAEESARQIQEEAKRCGYQEGYQAGYQQAYEEHVTQFNGQMNEFQKEIKSSIELVTTEKEKILEKYLDDLKRLTLSIAEKVIQTSLKSSGEVMERMIIAAAGKLKKTQWVKIYVAKEHAELMLKADTEFMQELSHISDNIKIIAMDHAEDGTCIIELPEEVIDVSVNTQIENIKGILNNARL